MVGRLERFIERLAFRRSLVRWADAAKAAPEMPVEQLRHMRQRARQLRSALDQVIHHADHRLALPLIGASATRMPPGTDWSWRPDLWRGGIAMPGQAALPNRSQIGDGTTIFHDCRQSELTIRQIRNTREEDVAPFGLRMDVFRFDGSFLSLVLDFPALAAQGLRMNHLLRIETIVETEKPLEIFARLNIKHGPNVEQVVRELPLNGKQAVVEFDLAYIKVNEKRIEKLWLDLIFEGPEMNQITLRDVTVSRRPRAEL